MCRSSGLSSASTETVRDSNAIPQMGQEPGWSRTISGCIGHVYSVFVGTGNGDSGSKAMPHFGHDPGPSLRTSGCIGQVCATFVVGFGVRVEIQMICCRVPSFF